MLILITVWVASSFDYFLINFQLKYIEGNIFRNTAASGLSELPAVILGGFLYYKVGIKITLVGSFTVAIIGGVLLIIFSDRPDLIQYFIFLAKCGVSSTFNIAYLANAQIFPAIFAGTAFGICNLGAKIATILAPLIAEVSPPAPMIIFVCLASIALVLSFLIRKDPTTTATSAPTKALK